MAFVRSIGRWTMTALVINGIIGAGIFALPGELGRLLGRASPFAMIFASAAMGIIMACVAEVASQFTEPGGAYLYTRTAFGAFRRDADWLVFPARSCRGSSSSGQPFRRLSRAVLALDA
jgi:amino acid transporter